jgi:hypothetical protein
MINEIVRHLHINPLKSTYMLEIVFDHDFTWCPVVYFIRKIRTHEQINLI